MTQTDVFLCGIATTALIAGVLLSYLHYRQWRQQIDADYDSRTRRLQK